MRLDLIDPHLAAVEDAGGERGGGARALKDVGEVGGGAGAAAGDDGDGDGVADGGDEVEVVALA